MCTFVCVNIKNERIAINITDLAINVHHPKRDIFFRKKKSDSHIYIKVLGAPGPVR